MTTDREFFGAATLEMYARLVNVPIYSGLRFEVKPDFSNFDEVMRSADFVLDCPTCPDVAGSPLGQAVRNYLEQRREKVVLLKEFALPTGESASLYKIQQRNSSRFRGIE